jgi:hypothetical protein
LGTTPKQVFRARGVEIPVASIAHLKQLKVLSGRPQDLALFILLLGLATRVLVIGCSREPPR